MKVLFICEMIVNVCKIRLRISTLLKFSLFVMCIREVILFYILAEILFIFVGEKEMQKG